MMFEFLVPGMQDTEESDLSAEMLGIPGDLDQRLGAEAEQQTINHFLVLQGQRRQFVWECENYVGVRRGQQFRAASSSERRALSQRSRTLHWHFGQCRLRHEL